jgi:hypothetical protein
LELLSEVGEVGVNPRRLGFIGTNRRLESCPLLEEADPLAGRGMRDIEM